MAEATSKLSQMRQFMSVATFLMSVIERFMTMDADGLEEFAKWVEESNDFEPFQKEMTRAGAKFRRELEGIKERYR